jgi:hypothetical protein
MSSIHIGLLKFGHPSKRKISLMTFLRTALVCLCVSCCVQAAVASDDVEPSSDRPAAATAVASAYSSSAAGLVDAPLPAAVPQQPTATVYEPNTRGGWTSTRPFSAVGIAVKAGVGGVGFDVATPLAKHFNLRGGASFFNYSLSTLDNGINYSGTLKLQSVNTSLDYYPFHGTFRLSPGAILHNGNHLSASAAVSGGQTFTLNDVEYTSDPSDPVSGTAQLLFGNKAAPSFTLGWGNMIPRHGGHWSVPFEVGFEYVKQPTVQLALQGTACQGSVSAGNCGNVATDPSIEANVQGEQATLNNDLQPLRFYPIVSLGISYKFSWSH